MAAKADRGLGSLDTPLETGPKGRLSPRQAAFSL